MSRKIIYIIGQRIGACVYLGNERIDNWRRYALFKCECDKEFMANIGKVKSGHTKSCGCALTRHLVGMNGTHMMDNSAEHTAWTNMKQRCENENNSRYSDWGGRGISVCERWNNSFMEFYKDMGDRPSGKHELDRYPDKNGNYEPGNCRWATKREQALNRRSNLMITYKGVTKPLKQWTDDLGLSYSMVSQRINKQKWSTERAFETAKHA